MDEPKMPDEIGRVVAAAIEVIEEGSIDEEVQAFRDAEIKGGNSEMRKFVTSFRWVRLEVFLKNEIEKRWDVDLSDKALKRINVTDAHKRKRGGNAPRA